jgi:hypothetical protein
MTGLSSRWGQRLRGGRECAAFGNKRAVLRPISRLLGECLNDDDIAVKLDLTEEKVRGCIARIVHFLELKSREELALYAQPPRDSTIARRGHKP